LITNPEPLEANSILKSFTKSKRTPREPQEKMATFELTERRVKNLFKQVCGATSKSQVETAFSKYFPGVFDAGDEKKVAKIRKAKSSSPGTKKSSNGKKAKVKTKSGSSSGSSGYKIIWVSGNLQYPSSKYKNKNSPMEAAESAFNGILRKTKIKKTDANFTFMIQDGDGPKYTYSAKGGMIKRAKQVRSSGSETDDSGTSWFD